MRHNLKFTQGTERQCGNITVEMALVLPVIALLLGGIYQYSSGMGQKMNLTKAARAAAEYAVANPSDTTGITDAARNAGNIPASGLTVATSSYCLCSDGTSISCSGTCTGGTNPEQYVAVTLTQTYQPLFSNTMLSTPSTLQGSATLRIK